MIVEYPRHQIPRVREYKRERKGERKRKRREERRGGERDGKIIRGPGGTGMRDYPSLCILTRNYHRLHSGVPPGGSAGGFGATREVVRIMITLITEYPMI